MIISGIQSLLSLLIAGIGCGAVFISPRFRHHRTTQEALIGLVMGICVAYLCLSAYEMDGWQIYFDAKAGPLVFAGYLGGPLGGAIAASLGWLCKLWAGESGPGILASLFVHFGLVTVGIVLRAKMPPLDWPRVEQRVVWAMLAGSAIVQLIAIFVVDAVSDGAPNLGFNSVSIVTLSVISILATYAILCLADRTARSNKQNADLTERLKLALHATKIGLNDWIVDSGFGNLDARTLEIYGMGHRDGPIALSEMNKIVHPDDLKHFWDILDQTRVLTNSRSFFDYRIIRPSDNETRMIRAHWTNRKCPDTDTIQVIFMVTDLTDYHNLETDRNQALERLQIASEAFPGMIYQGIWSLERAVQHLYLSSKCKTYWGVEPIDAYANPDLLDTNKPPEAIEEAAKMLLENVRSGKPIYSRSQVPGAWIDFYGNATDLKDGTYRVDGVVVDVTAEVAALAEAKRQTELAAQAQRLESIGQLTGGIAHDFNNLLAVIMGNLELLKDEVTGPKQQAKLDASLEATRRGAELTKSMLKFARRAPLEPVPLEMNSVVRHAKNWMNRALPATVDVELSLLAGLWNVRLDAAALESAILNLLLNARDAMDGHGKLTIETANVRIDEAYLDSRDEELVPGRYVMLAVSDTGKGISKDVLAQIFDPFFTTKGPGKGSGIGLSMVQGFVRQSGGTVQVYSEVGEGTSFKLYFPATNVSSLPKADFTIEIPPNPSLKNLNILLVEDESAVRTVLVEMLKTQGYHVTSAASGDEAMHVYSNSSHFDLVITDIVMPGVLQGTTLAKAIRVLSPDLPIIFMSGYAAEATVHGNGLRPEDIRLMKPVPKIDLLRAVEKIVRRLSTPPPQD